MKKILIIEDDFYVRDLYKKAFERKNYQVTEAENGEVALEKVRQEKFDFIILDLMLPKIPGIEVLKEIKASQPVPVYILTNVGDEHILQQAMSAGADTYFIKVDYTPKQLVRAIEERGGTN